MHADLRAPATPASTQRRGSIVAFVDDDAAARGRLARAAARLLRRSRRGGSRRRAHSAMDERRAALAADRVLLGIRLQLHRPARASSPRCATRSAPTWRCEGRRCEEIGGFRAAGAGEEPRAIRSRGVVRAHGNVPDDTDLAIRSRSSAGPSRSGSTEPRAKVHHTVTSERASLSYFIRRSFEEGAGKARLARLRGIAGRPQLRAPSPRCRAAARHRQRLRVSSSTGIHAAASGPSRSSLDSPPARSDSRLASLHRTRPRDAVSA